MNPDVQGEYRVASAAELVASDPAFIRTHSLVLATQLTEQQARPLAALCHEAAIPLIVRGRR